MTTTQFYGVYPAVITPFTQDGHIDLDGLAALLEWQLGAGVNGVYIGGNTGEWYAQSMEERAEVARTAIRVVNGRARVLVHVGAVNTEDALRLAQTCADLEADAISSLPPYVGRWSNAEIVHYYQRLCAATDLPCFVYHFPKLTGGMSAQALVAALDGQPRLAGLKYTDMDLFEMERVLAFAGGRLMAFNGHDQVLLPGLTMGASGGIGSFYNVIPERFVNLYCAYQRGDMEGARREQAEINGIIEVVKRFRLVPALRFLLSLRGIRTGASREPTLMLTPAEEEQLAKALENTAFAA